MTSENRAAFAARFGAPLVVAGLLLGVSEPEPAQAAPKPQPPEQTEILDAYITAGWGAEFFAVVETEFPDDYRQLLRAMTATAANGERQTPEGLRLASAAASDAMIKRNAHFAETAPPQAVRSYLASYAEALRSLSSSPRVCGKLAAQGYAALTPREARITKTPQMEHVAAQMMRTLALGRDKPVKMRAASVEDWREVFERWRTSHSVKPEWFDLISDAQNWRKREFCVATASFLDYLAATPGARTDRAARTFFVRIVGG
ncbi:hypothetical protein [Pseudodonghicola xiamenensis]|uniref:Uncharacterized protein n=1 Tax=Pseudodonghicola xiamenensis TaxID=337702 RepID=A0A8J3H960_9RHOB|nr:hypothetical protein [Pseudodonghicola xiamenensis]GHG93737.1 hypothetical protein GCM10010961_26400 [Pseudodonghicola xiamenensis]